MEVGRVASLWRYPVKSMRGERLERAVFGRDGVADDRGWAVLDVETGHILSAKRVDALLGARAVMRPGGPAVVFPDGNAVYVEHASDALSRFLGRAVRTVSPEPGARATIQGEERPFLGRPGGFFDSAAVHIVTTSTLAHLTSLRPDSVFDERRFRPNIVLETDGQGPIERSWIGRTLALGDVHFTITKECLRCVLTTAPQDELRKDREILGTVAREQDNATGVYAKVLDRGQVSVGDIALLT